MGAVYIVSTEEAAGKTTISAGLGKYLLGNGKKVGFLRITSASNDGDATFMKQILDLPEAAESLGIGDGDTSKVREAYNRVAPGKDVVIIEGRRDKSSGEIAKALKARVISVVTYGGQAASYADSYPEFGENLLGIVINKVPVSQLKRVQDEASAQSAKAGISLLGVIPEDRTLSALTVAEVADCIGGEILNNAEKSGELVENYMLGAMVVDSGLTYFGRKNNKAAIIRSERPDMQLAALETSTRCLVLSGKEPPIYGVREKAESKGIPIILTENDINSIVANIEHALAKTRFNQENKLPRLIGIIQQHLNLQAVA